MANGINWLHLTDWHVGQSHEWLWPRMREQVFDDLSALADAAGPWDTVFFSGDFVQKGAKDEFAKVTDELVKLWDHFEKLGSRPLLLYVPGNHDLIRPAETSAIVRQALRWHEPKEENVRKEFWDNPISEYREAIVSAFRNFSDWGRPDVCPIPQPLRVEGILPGDFSAVIKKNGFALGIVGLNTTYLQLAGDDFEGRLDIHVRQLIGACGQPVEDWRKEVQAALLMTHQPPEWLHEVARRQYTEIYELGRFHGHFCGHLHVPQSRETREVGGPTRRVRQGPSLFGLEHWGISETRRICGYTAGRWEFTAGHGGETMWPRKANQTYDETLQLGPDTGYRLDARTNTVLTTLAGHGVRSVPLDRHRLVLLERPLDAHSARAKLASVPRYRLKLEAHHRAVRTKEQIDMVEFLEGGRFVWLVADWGLGKDNFIACAFERLGGRKLLSDVFRIQCGDVEDCEHLQAAAEIQFGMSLQEFLAGVAALPISALILDDFSAAMVCGESRQALEQFLSPIFDFCPNLHLLLVVRRPPPGLESDRQIILQPLDLPDIGRYLHHHPGAQPGLERPHLLDRLQMWSGGLPTRLDQFLEQLRVFSAAEILDEEPETPLEQLTAFEPVPRALSDAVGMLAAADEGHSVRSYKLLKVLTVLRDGETFQSIRRFFPDEPFYPVNVSELIDLGLLEAVPISQTAAELSLHASRHALDAGDSAKLLRVPRQVRDYVVSRVVPEERADIIRASTFLLFGRSWWRGKIRLRNALFNSYSLSAIVGPGNEHVIARHLLIEALKAGSKHQTKRAIRLGLGLCSRLLGVDRFRDAAIACGAMVHLLKDTGFTSDSADAARMYAEALRMMDRYDEAIAMDKSALELGEGHFTDETKAEVHINMARSLKHLGEKEDALGHLGTALSLVHKDSSDAHDAESVKAELTLEKAPRLARLTELETSARNRGHTTAANNIALDLARDGTDVDESLKLLERVIRTAKDNYNRARAIIEKATVLNAYRSASELTERDRQLLAAAYGYTYAQRVGKLLDRCHRVLWLMLFKEQLWSQIVRLFRFSSLIWRMKGGDPQETKYLRELDAIDIQQLRESEGAVLHNEVIYLERRRQDCPSGASEASQ